MGSEEGGVKPQDKNASSPTIPTLVRSRLRIAIDFKYRRKELSNV